MKKALAALAGVMALGAASATHATTVNLDFALKASGFGAGAPVDPVVGNFKFTFDNNANIFMPASGMTVSGFNLPFVGTYGYNAATDTLFVGTDATPSQAPVFGKGGYGFSVLNASGAYSAGAFQYLIFDPNFLGIQSAYTAVQVTLTPATAPTGVPEPSAWALLIAGAAITGATLRAGRRQISRA